MGCISRCDNHNVYKMIKPILEIISRVTGLFNFNRKSRRRNSIDKLEKEGRKLAKLPWNKKRGRRMERVRLALRRLYKKSAND